MLARKGRSAIRTTGEGLNERYYRAAMDATELLPEEGLAARLGTDEFAREYYPDLVGPGRERRLANLRARRELAREFYRTEPETAEANPYRIPSDMPSVKGRRMAALVRANAQHREGY